MTNRFDNPVVAFNGEAVTVNGEVQTARQLCVMALLNDKPGHSRSKFSRYSMAKIVADPASGENEIGSALYELLTADFDELVQDTFSTMVAGALHAHLEAIADDLG